MQRDILLLTEMIDAAQQAQVLTSGVSASELEGDRRSRDALLWNVVVFEGGDESGYSAYSPDLPGVIAAGDRRPETERLMIEAMAAHIAMLKQAGEPVPEASHAADVVILEPAAA